MTKFRMMSVFVVLVMLFSFANISLSYAATLPAGEKVTVCHNPGLHSQKTINIDKADLTDHLGHGDLEGQCTPLQETIAYVCSPSDVEYETLYVSSEAGPAQNGTTEKPFGSVSAALQFAEKKDFPGVELQIRPGVYGHEAVVLSRPTRIVGPGQNENPSAELSLSIINDGANELGVQGVVFRVSNYGPAITVTDPSADTVLCGVRFDKVVGHALLQTGGTIYIEDGIFNSTARDPEASSDDHLTGTALVLAGGVTGSINDIHVDESSGSGLYVSGTGTKVDVDWNGSSQSIFENGTGCFGAVVVKGGAELNASHLMLDSNGVSDIVVEGNGTTVNLLFLTAVSTQYLEGGSDGTLETCGTNTIISVIARSGATLNITGTPDNPFLISDSALVGLGITDDNNPPWVSLSNGIVSNNVFGVYSDLSSCEVFDERFSHPNVLFINNEFNLQMAVICIPEPDIPPF